MFYRRHIEESFISGSTLTIILKDGRQEVFPFEELTVDGKLFQLPHPTKPVYFGDVDYVHAEENIIEGRIFENGRANRICAKLRFRLW